MLFNEAIMAKAMQEFIRWVHLDKMFYDASYGGYD